MPKLTFTDPHGKRHSALLVTTANAQIPNEIQTRQLEQINRILPPEILETMSARRLAIAPREIGLLLARLSKSADPKISVED
jgi:hypothetical protein